MRLLPLLTRPRWGSVSPAFAIALFIVACSSPSSLPTVLAEDRLVFLTSPSGVVAGQPFNPAVRVAIADEQGNTVNKNNVDITLYLNSTDPRDTLLGTVTVPTNAGVAVFTNLSLKRAITGFRIAAVARSLTGAMSSTFGVSVGPAAKLVFSVQPSAVIAGEKMVPAPQVVVQDAVGNVIPNDTGLVLISSLSPPGVTPRNNLVNEVNGVATFDSLRINRASSLFTLQATAPARSISPAASNVFVVSPGAPFRLAWRQNASNTGKNIVFSPPLTVAVADSMDNVVTSFTQPITIDIDPPTNTGNAVLNGTRTQACVSGIATFNNISVDRATVSSVRLRAHHATLGDTARGAFFQVF